MGNNTVHSSGSLLVVGSRQTSRRVIAVREVVKRMKRALILLASLTLISASMAWSPASGAVSPPKAVAATQTFTGGGRHGLAARWPYWTGRYTSTGQLGSGRYDIGGVGTTVAKFTRSDGMMMSGTFVAVPFPNDCGISDPALECANVDLAGLVYVASGIVPSLAIQDLLDRKYVQERVPHAGDARPAPPTRLRDG